MSHPEEAVWINRYREIRKQARQEKKQMDITTIKGGVAFEVKTMPDTIPCEVCGNTMDFVSQELGYSCRNGGCILHINTREEEEIGSL